MATQSVSIGQNSYLYSATAGTTHIKVLEDIVEIVTRDSGEKKLHGWESVGSVFNSTINFYGKNKSKVHSSLVVDAAYFLRSKNADGSYKHCAIIAFEGNKLGMLHYPNGFGQDYSNGAYIASRRASVRPPNENWEDIGSIDGHLLIQDDKFDCFLFVNPKWLAFAISTYSEEPYNNKSKGSYGNLQYFGLIGIFEVVQSIPGIKSVVANFGMLGFGVLNFSGVYGPTGIIHDSDYLDTTTLPLIYSCPSGSVAADGNEADLFYYAKEIPENVITGIDIYKGAALGASPPVKYGTLAGIKLASSQYVAKPLSSLNVRCDENLDLSYSGTLVKHFCVPAYFQYSWDFYGTKGSTRNYINTVIPA